jgi:hypothetical protein
MDETRRAALLGEYGEVCADFRALTTIRFQLLAFLPIGAATVAALRKDFEGVGEFALSLFGLLVTMALATYNERNNQLYNDLVQRAGSIERNLGVPDGAFANRPAPWLTFRMAKAVWKIDHGTAVTLIYAASVALWLFGVLSPLFHWANSLWLLFAQPLASSSSLSVWPKGFALIAAICIVCWGMSWISGHKQRRQEEMRLLARKVAAIARERNFQDLASDPDFIADCARLAGTDSSRVSAAAQYYGQVLDPRSLGYYMPEGPPPVRAAHTVALLTDLPPQWIFDCLTNRRGALKPQIAPNREEGPAH